MEIACPKCSAPVRLTTADLASRERLKAFRCDGCGVGFDARQQLAQRGISASAESSTSGRNTSAVGVPAAKSSSGSSLLKNMPTHIGQYQVLEEINRGGMGIVYKGFDPVLKRKVAIKVLLAGEGATETDIKRFQREAEATARLQHPNIVPIYAIGDVDGKPYFVMDFVEGQTAKQLMQRGEMSPRLALKIIEGAAEALQHAHEHGVIHRDVKPANILVNADERPQLMDFGLARRADEDLEITQSGTTMGTPSYMSPEQAEGKLDDIDERSDVYSAGACLYELLTNRVPFEGATTLSVLRKICEEVPLPPRRINPAINRDIETICLKCLEKKKAKRYGSAKELADDIRRFNDGEAILAKPAGPMRALWRRIRRHKEIFIAALVMLLSGVGVIVYTVNEARAKAVKETAERAARFKQHMEDAETHAAVAQQLLNRTESITEAEPFNRIVAQTREAINAADDAYQMAQALEPSLPEPKAGRARMLKLETQTDVARYIFKARSFLHPLPPSSGEDSPAPNYGGAEFAAQEAVDRDPKNQTARALLREALGMRKVWISLQDSAPGAPPCEVFARRIMDPQGRLLNVQNNEIRVSLGNAPVNAAELEPGFYIISFQRKGAGKQQAPFNVTRDSTDGDLVLVFPAPGKEENMALVSAGDVPFNGSGAVHVPAFFIDRYEYPNHPGAEPQVGASLIEARGFCSAQGKKLCSPAQWTRACMGENGQRFPYGAQYSSAVCATGFDKAAQTHPFFSGQFSRCRTATGVYDMVGNAAEWVDAPTETVMGGDWTSSNQAPELTGSCHTTLSGEDVNKDHRGFRCCKAP